MCVRDVHPAALMGMIAGNAVSLIRDVLIHLFESVKLIRVFFIDRYIGPVLPGTWGCTAGPLPL